MKRFVVETVSRRESELARQSSQEIADFANGDDSLHLTLLRNTGERVETEVPAQALPLFAQILAEIAKGNPVLIRPMRAELSTHEAAERLRVSRPYLIKLLESGKIPFRKVGAHRRIRYEDVLAYDEAEKQARKAALDEMTAEAQRLGLYE